MEAMIMEFLQSHPSMSVVLTVIAVFRLTFKPIMTVIEKYVEATPDKADDERLAKLKNSKTYARVAWVVDYLLSIKLPVKKE